MSESIIFLVLALVWVGYLSLWWRDSRKVSSHHRNDKLPSFGGRSSGSSRGGLALPAIAAPQLQLAPRSRAAAARRRREVLVALAVLSTLALLGAVVLGSVMWLAFVVVALATSAYGYACVQRRNDDAEREMKVTMLYPQGPVPVRQPVSPPAPLRRAAHG